MADAPNANDELYPIAVLIDELKVRTTSHAWLLLVRPSRHQYPPSPSPHSSSISFTLHVANSYYSAAR